MFLAVGLPHREFSTCVNSMEPTILCGRVKGQNNYAWCFCWDILVQAQSQLFLGWPDNPLLLCQGDNGSPIGTITSFPVL